jgi:hypothetical protein
MKRKIGIILTQNQQIRSWLNEENLKPLQNIYEITIYVPAEYSGETGLYSKNLNFYEIKKNSYIEKELLDLHLISHSNISSYKKKFASRFSTKFMEDGNFIINKLRKVYRERELIFKFLSKYTFNNKQKMVEKFIAKNLIKFSTQDIYILVVNMTDLRTEIVTRTLENSGSSFIQVVENWDNVSSKFCPSATSRALVVWGDQSKDHARLLHNISGTKIHSLGSSRIPNKILVKKLQSINTNNQDKKLKIFYPGYGSEIETLDWVKQIYDAIFGGSLKSSAKIIFRPHPLALLNFGRDYYSELPKEIEIDWPTSGSGGLSDWPNLDKDIYKKMLESDLVIGSPSTLLLEALVFQKPVLLDLRGKQNDLVSPFSLFSRNTHLKEIFDDRRLLRFFHAHQLPSLVNEAVETQVDLKNLTEYLVHNDETNFTDRLGFLLDKL